ncbi:MAG TPA: HD domain-containing protein [Myxococcota bacterium]|nr:HD domain-containing protein [Myxococcota bacterium]
MLEAVRPIAEAIRARGGRAIAVGGFVRDRLLGRPADEAKDLDVEVFGLAAPELEAVLRGFGDVRAFGRSFPVMRVVGREIDFCLARGSDFEEAARRRDLTIHAIGLDPLSGEILDPLGGRADLAARVLRAADARYFGSDPLRGLRVMQIAARFAMEPDAELVALCGSLDLSDLPGERVRVEFDKLLLGALQPSRGLAFLRRTDLLRFFPPLAALVGVPQDPTWHPEGDVWTHTARALDAAAGLRTGGPDDAALMYAVLCHDFGKPDATRERAGRVIAHGHERAGLAATRAFLERLRAPNALVQQVLALVEHHLAPARLPRDGAKPAAYRRLVRRLREANVGPELLERVARADHLGRTMQVVSANDFREGDLFITATSQIENRVGGSRDAVWGRHLLARGLEPGPEFARILARCREVQDETGESDPEVILLRVLGKSG